MHEFQSSVINSFMTFGIKYFTNEEIITADEIYNIYKIKSGSFGEIFFEQFLKTYGETNIYIQKTLNVEYKICKYESQYKKFRPDIMTNNMIYEIKNYLYDSTGTANEKLLEDIVKYEMCVKNNIVKNVLILLCAKFETLFMEKQFHYISSSNSNILLELQNVGVYMVFASEFINDFLYNDKYMTFIKWVGGKQKLLKNIVPKIMSKNKNIYVEPFLGSGSIAIELMKNKVFEKYILSDINKNLISTYNVIKDNVEELVKFINILKSTYDNEDDKEEFYYNMREEYNTHMNDENYINDFITNVLFDDNEYVFTNKNIFVAGLFIVLNKLCYRGMYRVNKNNIFNVPYGNYKNPSFIDVEYVRELSSLFNTNNVTFECKSFDEHIVTENEVIYLDPPYYDTYDGYSDGGFNYDLYIDWLNDIEFKENIVMSNSDSFKNIISNINHNFNIETITVNDSINSKKPNEKRNEIIIY